MLISNIHSISALMVQAKILEALLSSASCIIQSVAVIILEELTSTTLRITKQADIDLIDSQHGDVPEANGEVGRISLADSTTV